MLIFSLSTFDKGHKKRTFEQIFCEYDRMLHRCISKFLSDEEDIQDAMQNTWLGIFKKMDLCGSMDEDELRSYIVTIAKNQAISIVRKKQKENELFIDTNVAELVDDRNLFELCEREEISKIIECINMLSDAQKEVITMYYLYHLSLKEIAKQFGISESVAESRWNHGRARLMQLLQRKEIYEKKTNKWT